MKLLLAIPACFALTAAAAGHQSRGVDLRHEGHRRAVDPTASALERRAPTRGKGTYDDPWILTLANDLDKGSVSFDLKRFATSKAYTRSGYFKVTGGKVNAVKMKWKTIGGTTTCTTKAKLTAGKDSKDPVDCQSHRVDSEISADFSTGLIYSLWFETDQATCAYISNPTITITYSVDTLRKASAPGFVDGLVSGYLNTDGMSCGRALSLLESADSLFNGKTKAFQSEVFEVLTSKIAAGAAPGYSMECKAAGGLLNELKGTLGFVLDKMSIVGGGNRDADWVAPLFAGDCKFPSLLPNAVDIKKATKTRTLPSTFPDSTKPLRVLHLSDLHMDPLYKPGTEANCNWPMCCRTETNDLRPGKTPKKASTWGESTCDAPEKLIRNMFQNIAKTIDDLDYVVITGDHGPHNVWGTSETQNRDSVKTTLDLARSILKVPVYPAIGNHEFSPVNIIPDFKSQKFRPADDPRPMYKFFYNQAASWIGEEKAKDAADAQGNYFVKRGNLRLISLNTNMCYVNNLYTLVKSEDYDKGDTLKFLNNQLQIAETNGGYAWIIAHVSPSDTACGRNWSNSFSSIVKRYQETISAQFYGHTHRDEFAVFYEKYDKKGDDPQKPTSFALLAPSVTVYTGNPTYRVMDIDPTTFQIIDMKTYYADISKAAEWDRTGATPDWMLEYSHRDYLPGWDDNRFLDAGFFNALVNKMETDDATWKKYFKYRGRSAGIDNESCEKDPECRDHLLCDIRAGNAFFSCSKVDLFKRSANLTIEARAERLNYNGVHYQAELCDTQAPVQGHLRGHHGHHHH